jgi:hypothetical protein
VIIQRHITDKCYEQVTYLSRIRTLHLHKNLVPAPTTGQTLSTFVQQRGGYFFVSFLFLLSFMELLVDAILYKY